jgi:hypothetical protein
VEAMSRIYACKTERNLQIFWLVLAIQTVMPVGYTILLLSAKQRMEINAMRRVVSEMYQKSSALSIRFECEEVSLQIEFTTLPPKNHNLFVKVERKGNWRKRNCGHRLIMHSITRREGEW